METDPFSEIVELTQARAVHAGGFTAGGPWAIQFRARYKIKMSAILHGGCWLWLEGETEPLRLEAGDVCLLTAQRSYIMASDPGLDPVEATSLFSGGSGRALAVIGDGADFSFIGGHILMNPANGWLLAEVLPPWLHIKADAPEAPTFRWLLDQLVEEASTDLPGAQLVSTHLSQLLFTQILRAHLRAGGPLPAGWLRALADVRAAPALRLMHGDPGRSWSLGELARACGMSRTTFAGHFKTVSGKAPLTYLTDWRMRLAERALREETTAVAVIGQSLGYTSESAFSNAFKRVTGVSPRACRSAARHADAGDLPQ
ncbi:AraC family transcriptional regulator [Brevundimonas sp. FT23042]|uniref:AraC family transcriptional regulator n=1 Tax=Brevundimonas sp. FT23042 TaxID=3393749 RepID=UPI003B58687B